MNLEAGMAEQMRDFLKEKEGSWAMALGLGAMVATGDEEEREKKLGMVLVVNNHKGSEENLKKNSE